jgi:hypothetical protein
MPCSLVTTGARAVGSLGASALGLLGGAWALEVGSSGFSLNAQHATPARPLLQARVATFSCRQRPANECLRDSLACPPATSRPLRVQTALNLLHGTMRI